VSKVKATYLQLVKLSIALLFYVLWFSSCNNQKYLTEGEVLYTGAEIKYVKTEDFKINNDLKAELENLPYPEPNQVLLGISRPKLWFYNTTKEPKREKGFRYWKKYKLGAPPVLFEETNPDRIEKLINNRLNNFGHFQSQVSYEIVEGKKKEASVKYTVTIKKPYLIDSIFFPSEQDNLNQKIKASQAKTLLKAGDQYNLSLLKKERERISEQMNDLGFYYFEPDFLIFEVDTNLGNHKVNVYLKVKKNIAETYLQTKKIGKIYVYSNYDLRKSQDSSITDTLLSNGKYYLLQDSSIRPEIVTDAIYLDSGSYYSKRAHDYTINRLTGLGVYQFVSIKYVPDSSGKLLNPHIRLTPNVNQSLRLEVSGTSKSNGFTGPGFKTSYRNKNLFRGAEMLSVNLIGGYEAQIATNTKGLNSYELGINTELGIPRFLLPFGIKTTNNRFTPYTNFRAGFRLLNRMNYYQLNSLEGSFGYRWRETAAKKHELLPISMNYVRLTKSSTAFDEILSQNPLVKKSFEEQFIFGTTYSFTYDSRSESERKNSFYFKGGIDLAGNISQLIQTFSDEKSFGDKTDYELLGTNFSQYARLETTFKYFIKLKDENVLANRLIMAAGVPYGNAEALPYIKQFFIGGGNSIRAFQARSLGPGTYHRSEGDESGNFFIDQSGDIKFEFNSEFRFDIFSIYKAAVFVDAGNIWLLNDDPLRPGGDFRKDKFFNELAIGTGFGLRIDPDFFVIRLDLGFPLRKPYLAEGERWVLRHFGKDAVLNIAIGYPF